jgi:hypothetical protein
MRNLDARAMKASRQILWHRHGKWIVSLALALMQLAAAVSGIVGLAAVFGMLSSGFFVY